MVRSWSYINQINALSYLNLNTASNASFESVVNSHMYLSNPFNDSTTLTRRKWASRSHLTNWISLSTVMSHWSSAYLFNNRVLNSLYSQLLTKHSFIALSVLNFNNTMPSLHNNTENLLLSSVTNSVLNYFSMSNLTSLSFFSSLNNLNVTFVSTVLNSTTPLELNTFQNSSVVVPLLVDAGTNFTPNLGSWQSSNPLLVLSTLSSVGLLSYLKIVLSIRSAIILLTVLGLTNL